jgi:hypothetical protein
MLRTVFAIGFVVLGWVDCVSAEPLYLTTSAPRPDIRYGSNESYAFIAPYFTEVQTLLSVSITKVAATGNSTPKSASILAAKWDDQTHNLTFSASCDLTSLILPPTKITVANAHPDAYAVQNAKVDQGGVTKNIVVAAGPSTDPGEYDSHNGTIQGVNCPPPADTFNVTFTATPVGKTRGYLYLRRNAFFSDTVNVSVGSDGLLSSSDSSSVQQITAILNELAQTATSFFPTELAETVPSRDPRQTCYETIINLVKSVYNHRS